MDLFKIDEKSTKYGPVNPVFITGTSLKHIVEKDEKSTKNRRKIDEKDRKFMGTSLKHIIFHISTFWNSTNFQIVDTTAHPTFRIVYCWISNLFGPKTISLSERFKYKTPKHDGGILVNLEYA